MPVGEMRQALLNPSTLQSVEALFAVIVGWQAYLEVSGRAGANTRRQYRRAVLNFLADIAADPAWQGPRSVGDLTEDDLVGYLTNYTEAKGGQRAMMLKALRSFYSFLCARDHIPTDPTVRLKPKRPKTPPAPSLAVGEIEQVIAACEKVDPRAGPALTLQYVTACRVSSLVGVLPEDVRVGAGWSVYFREAKGERPYTVPLSPKGRTAAEELLALRDYAPKRGTRRPNLIGVGYERYRTWMKQAAADVGVDVWTHLVRHTAITRLAERPDVDVRSIQEIANWEDPRLLRRYAAANNDNMRHAVAVL